MLNVFSQIANLASGTLVVAAAVAAVAPQVSAETHRQATLDLTGVALQEAATIAGADSTNAWVLLGASLLPVMYNEVMVVVNKHGLIATSIAQSAVPAVTAAKAQA